MAIDPSDPIVTVNENQQTGFDPADAKSNIEASAGSDYVFGGLPSEDKDKVVVFVGGGSAAEFDAVVAPYGGDEAVKVIAAGSAAMRLNREAQEVAGYPVLRRADAIILNGVDDGKQGEYYTKIRAALEQHPHVDVFLASYNGPEAYEALRDCTPIRVAAKLGDYKYPEYQVVVGLGSTAPTAATILMMMEGHTAFEYVGVTGATLEDAPADEGLSVAAAAFADASAKISNPDRYPEYEMPAKWQKISPGNKVVVYVGDNKRAAIPSGQWYQLQELKRLVEYGREHGMRFTFHGENSLSKAVLMDGQDATLVYDPRKPGVEAGTKITGLKAPETGAAPESRPEPEEP